MARPSAPLDPPDAAPAPRLAEPLAQHAAAVRRLAQGVVFDAHLADDVAQDSLCVAVGRPPQPGRSWVQWLAGIVRNVARNRLRADRRRRVHEGEAARRLRAGGGDSDPGEHVVRIEEGRRVLAALGALEEPYRRTLSLRYLDDLSMRSVAERTGVPLETARTRLRVGLARLRAHLGVGERDPRGREQRALWALAGAGRAWSTGTLVAALGGLFVKKSVLAVGLLALAFGGGAAWWFGSIPREQAHERADLPPAPPDVSPSLEGQPRAQRPGGTQGAPRTRSLIGRVLAPGSLEPVAGAAVFVEAYAGGSDRDVDPGDALAFGSGTSDALGRVHLGLAPGVDVVRVVARHAGFGPGVGAARVGAEFEIVLGELRILSGRVHDLEDRPVPGARLTWSAEVEGRALTFGATSDEQGRYGLRVPTYQGIDALAVALEVEADGFAPVRVPLARVEPSSGEPLDVLLLRGGTLTGRVLDEVSGQPLVGACVFLWQESELSTSPGWDGRSDTQAGPLRALGQTRSDGQGRYRFERLPAWSGWPIGMWIGTSRTRRLGYVAASAAGHATSRRDVNVPDDGQELGLDLNLPPAGTVRGRVVDAQGAPIAGAAVHWVWADGSMSGWVPALFDDLPQLWTTTDTEGRYALDGVAAALAGASRARLGAQPAGAHGWNDRVLVSVAPPAGGLQELEPIVLPRSARVPAVELRVSDEAGEPVRGARVVSAGSVALSDAAGRLRMTFDGLSTRSGERVVLEVQSPGHLPEHAEAVPDVDAPALVRVTLRPGRQRPQVTLPTWSADDLAPRLSLDVRLTDARTGRPILRSEVHLGGEGGQRLRSPSPGAMGRSPFHQVAPGPWRIHALAPGYEEVQRDVTLREGDPPLRIHLELEPTAGVRVRVLDRNDAVFPDGRLTFTTEGQSVSAELDALGRALVRGLRPGVPYEVACARAPGQGAAQWFVPEPFAEVTLPADAREWTVILAPAGVATLRVQGTPLGHPSLPTTEQAARRAGTQARLVDAGGRTVWLRRHLRGGGWSVFAPPGTYTLHLDVPGCPALERSVTLTTDPSSTIDVDVP